MTDTQRRVYNAFLFLLALSKNGHSFVIHPGGQNKRFASTLFAIDGWMGSSSASSYATEPDWIEAYLRSFSQGAVDTSSASTFAASAEELLNNLPLQLSVSTSSLAASAQERLSNLPSQLSAALSSLSVVDDQTGHGIESGAKLADATAALQWPDSVLRISDSITPQFVDVSYDSLRALDHFLALSPLETSARGASVMTSAMASQLSDVSYHSLLGDTHMFLSAEQAVEGSRVVEFVATASDSLNVIAGQASETGSALAKASAQAIESTLETEKAKISIEAINAVNTVSGALDAQKAKMLQETTSAVNTVSEKSFLALADNVIKGLEHMGVMAIKVLNTILQDFGQPSLDKLFASATASVHNTVNGGIDSVTHSVKDMGNINLEQMILGLVTVFKFVMKILFIILNSVVKVMSGNSIPGWAAIASGAVQSQTNELTAQVSAAAVDFSHTSISELSTGVAHLSEEAGKAMVGTAGIIAEALSSGVTQIVVH